MLLVEKKNIWKIAIIWVFIQILVTSEFWNNWLNWNSSTVMNHPVFTFIITYLFCGFVSFGFIIVLDTLLLIIEIIVEAVSNVRRKIPFRDW